MATNNGSRVTFHRRVPQREIAERAGVSISTVSRVLNNSDGIREDLRQRVFAAVAELGYSNTLRTASSPLQHINLFVNNLNPDPSLDPFHAAILAGVEAECRRHGMDLSYAVVESDAASRAFTLEKARQKQVDGIILVSIDDPILVEQLLEEGRPTVLINAEHPMLPIDTFLPDNEVGPRLAVDHLVAHGHRRILHVTSLYRPTLRRRHAGYRAALEAAGIPYDPALVLDVPLTGAYDAVSEALATGMPNFTAVFAMNDLMAMAVMQALQAAGRRVPQDISVVGYTDIPLASLLSPPLTSVRIESAELGARAVRGLLERAAAPHQTPLRLDLATRLIERRSVAHVTPG